MPTRVPGVLPLPSSLPPPCTGGTSLYYFPVPGVLIPPACTGGTPLRLPPPPPSSRCFPLYRGYSKGLRGKEVLKDFRV
jgi:hypothetical protein